jgi:hypothetical protein
MIYLICTKILLAILAVFLHLTAFNPGYPSRNEYGVLHKLVSISLIKPSKLNHRQSRASKDLCLAIPDRFSQRKIMRLFPRRLVKISSPICKAPPTKYILIATDLLIGSDFSKG